MAAVTANLTSHTDIDLAIDALGAHADEWAQLPIPTRLSLLRDLEERTARVAEDWVRAAVAAKGLPADSPLAGEEWLSGPYAVIAWADAHHRALDRIWRGETSYEPGWVRTGLDGRTVVDVLPADWRDRLLLSGYGAEVWMQADVTPANLADHTASLYRGPAPEGRVCAVLGAGNIASIPPLDVLYKLYAEGQVVVLKMNPVNDYLGPIFEDVFAKFVERGYVRFAYGDGGVGAYLTTHPKIDTIHITGSERTHDLIVFGGGEDGKAHRERNDPILDKPITSELGGVSPAIVVPGPWTEADLRFQAENFVTQKLHNGGFNCIASQVLVVPDGWEHTQRFLDMVEETIGAAPPRPPYYPGAAERHRSAVERHEHTVHFDAGSLRAHLRNVAPDSRSFVFTEEFFSSVFGTTHLPYGGDAGRYLDAAVAFANDTLHGTLGATVMIHPATIDDLDDRFERALADMRYGCIGINVWSALGFLSPRATWGGFPGAPLNAIESGRGVVHNALLFDKPEKTVVRGPFRPFHRAWRGREFHLAPKPPWFVTNKTAAQTARLLTTFAAEGKLRTVPVLFASALRG